MAEAPSLTTLANLQNDTSATTAINGNFTAIATAFEDVLSLSGTAPNQMQSLLDMNSNRILNLPAPASNNEPARFIDIGDAVAAATAADASAIAAATSAATSAAQASIASTKASAANTSATAASNSAAAALTSQNAAAASAAGFLASPTFTGIPRAPTATVLNNSTQLATTAYVDTSVGLSAALLAPKNSPALTGSPTAPTATAGANSTQLATTAYSDRATSAVQSALFSIITNKAAVQVIPTTPSGTTSTSAVMGGMGSTCHLATTFGSKIFFQFQGNLGSATSGQSASVQALFGTGTAPAQSVAQTGTAVGSLLQGESLDSFAFLPFSAGGIVTGLTPGTTYWFDLSYFTSFGSSQAFLNSITFSAYEI